MFLRLLKAEGLKLKRSPVWLAFVIIPVIPAVLGTLNYMYNIDILTEQWESLWTQHTLFTCYFFLPVLIGIYCAYIMNIENSCWNKVLTMPVKRTAVFMAKLCSASFMVLLSELLILALFRISGGIIGLTTPFPLKQAVIRCIFGTMGGITAAGFQLLLSLYIRNFALPTAIALCGGISALGFISKDLGNLWLYSLMAYGMNSNSPNQLSESGYFSFIGVCIMYIICISILSNIIFSRKDF